jgi:hypothetical protein
VVASESGGAGNPGTLGMTILFANVSMVSKIDLSSRPERSVGIGGATPASAQCLAAITNCVPDEIL